MKRFYYQSITFKIFVCALFCSIIKSLVEKNLKLPIYCKVFYCNITCFHLIFIRFFKFALSLLLCYNFLLLHLKFGLSFLTVAFSCSILIFFAVINEFRWIFVVFVRHSIPCFENAPFGAVLCE